jgi:hypothetical protein
LASQVQWINNGDHTKILYLQAQHPHRSLHLPLVISVRGFNEGRMLMSEELLIKYFVKRQILDVQLINRPTTSSGECENGPVQMVLGFTIEQKTPHKS